MPHEKEMPLIRRPRTPPRSIPATQVNSPPSPEQSTRRSIDSDTPITPGSISSSIISLHNTPITPNDAYAGLRETSPKLLVDHVRWRSKELQQHTNDATRDPSEFPLLLFHGAGLFGELNIGSTIGSGQWSSVHCAWVGGSQPVSCEHCPSQTAKLFAAKVAAGKSAIKVMRHEARILSRLTQKAWSQKYVLGFYGYDMKHNALVLEYLGPPHALELHTALDEQPLALFPVTKGLVAGLDFLHAEGVVHGDIKPTNIFVRRLRSIRHSSNSSPHEQEMSPTEADESDEADYQPIYCDFSASRFDDPNALPTESAGTYDFMSPELFSTSIQAGFPTKASDVYALGVTLITVAAGKSPYDSASSGIARRAMAMQGKPLEFLAIDFQAWERFEASGLGPWVREAIAKGVQDRCSASAWKKSIQGVSSL